MPVSLSSSYFALQPLGISTSASKLLGVMREGSISCQMFIAVTPYFDLASLISPILSYFPVCRKRRKKFFRIIFTFSEKNFDFPAKVCYIVRAPWGNRPVPEKAAKQNDLTNLTSGDTQEAQGAPLLRA